MERELVLREGKALTLRTSNLRHALSRIAQLEPEDRMNERFANAILSILGDNVKPLDWNFEKLSSHPFVVAMFNEMEVRYPQAGRIVARTLTAIALSASVTLMNDQMQNQYCELPGDEDPIDRRTRIKQIFHEKQGLVVID